jgi:hypothetical protein
MPTLDKHIEASLGPLLNELAADGWSVTRAQYDATSFGNILVEMHRGSAWIVLTRDRSQFIIDAPDHAALRAAGLFRAFDSVNDFKEAVLAWLRVAAA